MILIFVKYNRLILTCGLLLITLSLNTFADDKNLDTWPQYRGLNRDGIAHSTDLLKSWPENGPDLVWKIAIGAGFSGMSISGEQLFTMFAADSLEYLGCFDITSGEEIWRFKVGKLFVNEFGNGPRSTPTIDGNIIFALSSTGNLFAINKRTRQKVWMISLTKQFGSKTPLRGFSTSPLVSENMLVLDVGGGKNKAVAALDKQTGTTLWTNLTSNPNYTSPVAVTFNDIRQFIFILPGRVTALSSKGDSLWSAPIIKGIIAMPVFIPPDKIFVSSAIDPGCSLIKMVTGSEAIKPGEVWNNKVLKNHFNSSLYHNNHLYGFSNATLKCVDVETGKQKWAKRGHGKGSLILAEERLIILSDRGRLTLIEASPESYVELGTIQAIEGKSWTEPTLANGHLYVRNLKQMACFDLRKNK